MSQSTCASHPGSALPRTTILLFAVACGLAVANVYYAQPLLDTLAREFGIDGASIGLVITVTQVGYGLGLLLLVPLGDLWNRRRLIIGLSSSSALALLIVAFAHDSALLLVAMAFVGWLAVVTQILVAYAAALADPHQRGSVVGTVTSGIIIGILLARTVSGTLSDAFGWRSVYFAAAFATVLVTALLARVLPREETRSLSISYPQLVGSVFTLIAEEPVLRTRAVLALLIFSAITVLWTPMALPLGAPPFCLSHTKIGLLGLAGAMGAVGASSAGRIADKGHAERMTGIALLIMLISWIPVACLPISLASLIVGVFTIDFGLQAVHVTNQSLIYQTRPEARSRLTAAYMIFYSSGCAIGSIASTMVYAAAGWWGVSTLGGGISAAALIFWAVSYRRSVDHRTGGRYRPNAVEVQ